MEKYYLGKRGKLPFMSFKSATGIIQAFDKNGTLTDLENGLELMLFDQKEDVIQQMAHYLDPPTRLRALTGQFHLIPFEICSIKCVDEAYVLYLNTEEQHKIAERIYYYEYSSVIVYLGGSLHTTKSFDRSQQKQPTGYCSQYYVNEKHV